MIYRGSSPADGAARFCNPFRADLFGILAGLYGIYWLEQEVPISSGTATLYCDNRKALWKALNSARPSIKDATSDDYDIIVEIKRILATLQTKITPTWVKGHYEGEDDDQTEYTLNHMSHSDAVSHRQNPPSSLSCTAPQYLPSSHIIAVSHNGDMVTSHLSQVIREELHYQPLTDKILKDTKWTAATFDKVDWDAYHKALHRLPRCSRISIIQLSNTLWNTNKYYSASANCPCCSTHDETFTHVFSCSAKPARLHRDIEKLSLSEVLNKIKTPQEIQDQFFSGLQQWESGEATIKSPRRDSVTELDTILTNAFTEQTKIGWENFVKP
jgi:hypothetical protein